MSSSPSLLEFLGIVKNVHVPSFWLAQSVSIVKSPESPAESATTQTSSPVQLRPHSALAVRMATIAMSARRVRQATTLHADLYSMVLLVIEFLPAMDKQIRVWRRVPCRVDVPPFSQDHASQPSITAKISILAPRRKRIWIRSPQNMPFNLQMPTVSSIRYSEFVGARQTLSMTSSNFSRLIRKRASSNSLRCSFAIHSSRGSAAEEDCQTVVLTNLIGKTPSGRNHESLRTCVTVCLCTP